MKHRVTLIGAGRAGSAVARALRSSGAVIDAVISPNKSHAVALAKELKCHISATDVAAIPRTSSLIVIAVPDKEIQAVANQILPTPNPSALTPKTAVHLSGALTREALAPLHKKGIRTLALHPAFPFISRKISASQLENIGWGVDCLPRDWRYAQTLVRSMRGVPVRIPSSQRMAYHAACAIISNYAVTIAETAVQLGEQIGLSRKDAESVLYPALIATVESIVATRGLPIRKRLTGPVSRGDTETIKKHLSILARNPDTQKLYRALMEQTVKLLGN